MENASKALIIAGAVLISVMLLGILVWAMNKASTLPENQNAKDKQMLIDSFNSQFSTYLTESNFNGVTSFGSTVESMNLNNDNTTKRYTAARDLNNISDVITAINLASNINYTNNYGYDYDYLETVNTVEIIIDFGKPNFIPGVITSRYYIIEPNKGVKPSMVYGTNSIGTKNSNISNFSIANPISTYKLLENLRESKLVLHDNTNYTLYKYYFSSSYVVNDKTDKIDSVTFKIVEDLGYNFITYDRN